MPTFHVSTPVRCWPQRSRSRLVILLLIAMAAVLSGQDTREAPPPTYTNSLGMTFVWINPGSFQMGSESGSDNAKPVHTVTISRGFYLQTTEVTQAQWDAVMGTIGGRFRNPAGPVDYASWNTAQEFLRRVNSKLKDGRYRLPTEAEWEYACRAGGREPDGLQTAEELNEVAWWWYNSKREPHPVAQKKANAWRLFDMRGNVDEWCQDWYDEKFYENSPRKDPTGPASATYLHRVVRGGSCGAGDPDVSTHGLRCSDRDRAGVDCQCFGFRCVLSKH